MPRPLRVQFPGCCYHVWIRGNRGGALFRDERDRLWFLEALEKVLLGAGAPLFAYCLLRTSARLALQTRDLPISRVMQRLLTGYAIWFNRRPAGGGHVFHGRYGSEAIYDLAGLLPLVRDIHLAPVAGGWVGDAADWPWSSHHAYLLSEPPPFLAEGIARARRLLGRDAASAREGYRLLMGAQGRDPGPGEARSDPAAGPGPPPDLPGKSREGKELALAVAPGGGGPRPESRGPADSL